MSSWLLIRWFYSEQRGSYSWWSGVPAETSRPPGWPVQPTEKDKEWCDERCPSDAEAVQGGWASEAGAQCKCRPLCSGTLFVQCVIIVSSSFLFSCFGFDGSVIIILLGIVPADSAFLFDKLSALFPLVCFQLKCWEVTLCSS